MVEKIVIEFMSLVKYFVGNNIATNFCFLILF